jgi:hypothetical protein
VDRIAADEASSDVVVADPPMGLGARRGNGDQDTLYRRPAEPGDSSWFAGTASSGADAVETPVAGSPGFGPTPPSGPGPGRTSFGFSGGPISPVRPTAAAGVPEPAPAPLPVPPVAPAQPRELVSTASPSWPQSAQSARMTPQSARMTPPPGRVTPPPAADPLPIRTAAAASVTEAPAWRPSDTGSWQTGESAPVTGTGSWSTGESAPVAGTGSWPTGEPAWRSDTGGSAAWPADTGARAGRDVRELRELRAAPTTEPAAPPRVAETLPPRQPRIITIGIAVLSAIVLLAGTIIGVVYFSGSDDSLDSVLKLGTTGSNGRVVSAPLDNRSTASFELLAGANVVNVKIGELGDDLYRISTPEDAGIRPSPVLRDDALQLQVNQDGDGTGGEIDVVLAATVTWSLRFSGYVQEEHVDLTDGQVSAIDMVGAAKHAELLLPKPSGTVPIKVAGAVDALTLQSPAGSPVRIQVGGGAQTVVAGTRTLRDVAPGSTLTPKDWATNNRYDVTAASRVTALSVQTVEN